MFEYKRVKVQNDISKNRRKNGKSYSNTPLNAKVTVEVFIRPTTTKNKWSITIETA